MCIGFIQIPVGEVQMLRRSTFALPSLLFFPSVHAGATGEIAKEIIKQVSINVLTSVLTDTAKAALSPKSKSVAASEPSPVGEAPKIILDKGFIAGTESEKARIKSLLEKLWDPNTSGESKADLIYGQIDYMSSGVVSRAAFCQWLSTYWRNLPSYNNAYAKVKWLEAEYSTDRSLITVKYRVDYIFKFADHDFKHGNQNMLCLMTNRGINPQICAIKRPGLAGFFFG